VFNKSNNKSPVFRGVILAVLLAMIASPVIAKDVYLVAKPVTLTMHDGSSVVMWGYAVDADSDLTTDGGETATVPGPQIEVAPGDSTLTIHLRNDLTVPTSIGISGQQKSMTPVLFPNSDPNFPDRIRSFDTETAAGAIGSYTWTGVAPGTNLYGSVTHIQVQRQMGLYGAMTKNAAIGEAYPGKKFDTESLLVYSEIDPALHAAVAGGNYGPGQAMTSTIVYEPKYFLINGVHRPYLNAGDGVLSLPLPDVDNAPTAGAVETFPGVGDTDWGSDGTLDPADVDVAPLNGEVEGWPGTGDTDIGIIGVYEEGLDTDVAPLIGFVHVFPEAGDTDWNGNEIVDPADIDVAPTVGTIHTFPEAEDFDRNGDGIFDGIGSLATNETMLIRFVNAGLRTVAPMFLGERCPSIAEDGNPYPYERDQYTVDLWAGATRDCLLTPSVDGTVPIVERRTTGQSNGGQLAFVTVGANADSPTADDDDYATTEDIPLFSVAAPGVLIGDMLADGGVLTASLVSSTTNGSLTLNADGSFDYTPNPDFNGIDSFTYRAVETIGMVSFNSNVATVVITVAPAQDAPVAMNDGFQVLANIPTTDIAAPGVLLNDSDIDGESLTASVVAQPAVGQGVVAMNPNGSFTYDPQSYAGPSTSFTYVANDGTGDSNVATVTLTVVNVAPVAVADNHAADEEAPLVIPDPSLNDTDANGDTLSVVAFDASSVAGGTVVDNLNGTFTYTSAVNYNGPDSFNYTVTDGLESVVGTVNIWVGPANDPPVAVNDGPFDVFVDVPTDFPAPGVLLNDTDIDGNTLIVFSSDAVSVEGGTVVVNFNGSFSYTPPALFVGEDSFTYVATDGIANSASATVSINVVPLPNIPPVANDDETVLPVGNNNSITINVVTNDTDADGTIDPNSVSIIDEPAGNIDVVNNGDGTVELTRGNNSQNQATRTFTYTVNDNDGDVSNVATVTIFANAP